MVKQAAVAFVCLLNLACSESNNLLMGTVSAQADGHHIVVTDCYRTEVPPPVKVDTAGARIWRYTPCRDAAIEIEDGTLKVNGRSYGRIGSRDGILVDHGVVSVQRDVSAERAQN